MTTKTSENKEKAGHDTKRASGSKQRPKVGKEKLGGKQRQEAHWIMVPVAESGR